MKTSTLANFVVLVGVVSIAGLSLSGCDRESATSPEDPVAVLQAAPGASGEPAPADLVTAGFTGQEITFWPYTGMSFDGTPSDPINLIFVGKTDPMQIRAALLALDGDRTVVGLPPVFPFTEVWRDAVGGVQTCYAEGGGWLGSVIQLELGSYESIRFHLRLFGTGIPYGNEGEWVLGAAHMDVLIPGTADHQVLSWGVPQQVVIADFIRSGLLDPAVPMAPTGLINQTPSFREIPAPIYNGLPPELIALIDGPAQPAPGDVPIPNSGAAMVLNLAGTVPIVADQVRTHLAFEYQQVIPKPFCMSGPFDFVLLTGPIDFHKTVTVSPSGGYHYTNNYRGLLTVTPLDITADPPSPIAEPYQAVVNGNQEGHLSARRFWVQAQDRRIGPQEGGTELLMTRLKVASTGANRYQEKSHCLSDSP